MGLKLFKSAKKRRKLNKTKTKRDLSESWNELIKKFGGSTEKRVVEFKPLVTSVRNIQQVLNLHSSRSSSQYPSLPFSTKSVQTKTPKYSGEMKKRELAAQKETQRKKKMVAPLYNKGPAAYVAGYNPKDLGKKT